MMMIIIPNTAAHPTAAPITTPLPFPLVLAPLSPVPPLGPGVDADSVTEDDYKKYHNQWTVALGSLN